MEVKVWNYMLMASASPAIRLSGKDIFPALMAPIRTIRRVINGNTPLCDRDFLEIAVAVGGSATERTIYGEEPVRRGDVFILRPGAWHAYQNAQQLELYECQFGMELLQRELAWTRTDPAMELMFWDTLTSLDRRGVLKLQVSPAALEKCDRLLGESIELSLKESSAGRAEEIGRLLLFLAEIGRELLASVQNIRKGKPLPHQAVTEGIRIMEEDIRRDWTLPELAKRLNVDKSYLVRLFRSHTGSPPMQFLAKLRAERAATLLLRTHRDISVIGQQVGWSDANYFARRFKAHLGMSATKYRHQFSNTGQAVEVDAKE
jgi:AraC family L-rhamnose operon transcriptional activator RhaR